MTSAERSRAYTSEYIRFDQNVFPAREKPAAAPAQRSVPLGTFQRIQAFFILLLCGFVLIGLIGVNAFSSKLQYDINTLNRSVLSIERAVQNLEVEIQTATSIATVEAKARSMGMVYPTFQEMVYLDGCGGVQGDFALALCESAYE
jgi:cell division protein FtsL